MWYSAMIIIISRLFVGETKYTNENFTFEFAVQYVRRTVDVAQSCEK